MDDVKQLVSLNSYRIFEDLVRGSRTGISLSGMKHRAKAGKNIQALIDITSAWELYNLDRVSKKTEDTIKLFLAAGHAIEDSFDTIEGGLWEFTCHKCSNDEYTKGGVGTGKFVSSYTVLINGSKPCRCSGNYRWNQEQREYKIKALCEEENSQFIGWESTKGYANGESRFVWVCKEGHRRIGQVNNFINTGNRCLTCAQEAGDWGYYPDRVNEADNLYLLSFKSETEAFLKVGRSFDVKERMREFLKHYEVEVITTYQNCHQKIFDTEQDIHSYLKSLNHHYTPKVEFGGSVKECFKLEALSTAEDIFYDLQLPLGFIE